MDRPAVSIGTAANENGLKSAPASVDNYENGSLEEDLMSDVSAMAQQQQSGNGP